MVAGKGARVITQAPEGKQEIACMGFVTERLILSEMLHMRRAPQTEVRGIARMMPLRVMPWDARSARMRLFCKPLINI